MKRYLRKSATYEIMERLKDHVLAFPENERAKAASNWMKATFDYDVDPDHLYVTKDGIVLAKRDKGGKYDEESISEVRESVSRQLELFSESELWNLRNQGRSLEKNAAGQADAGRDAGKRDDIYTNPILRDGVSSYYSHEESWNGNEESPWTVKEAWDKFGFVDFLGHRVESATDIAQMFSIYRNPALEYFHIVLVRDNTIVHQAALSSGLSSVCTALPAGGFSRLQEKFADLDFDSAYLVHNHPSGDIQPSPEDIGVTSNYIHNLLGSKFKGHLILDHDKFCFLYPVDYKRLAGTVLDYKPHVIPKLDKYCDNVISSYDDIAAITKEMHIKGPVAFELDNAHQIRSVFPFDVSSYTPESLIEKMKADFARNIIIAIDSPKDAKVMLDRLKSTSGDKTNEMGLPLHPLLDCVVVSDKGESISFRGSDKFAHYDWQARRESRGDFLWDRHRPGENKTSSSLFSMSASERKAYDDAITGYIQCRIRPEQITLLSRHQLLSALGFNPGKISFASSSFYDLSRHKAQWQILSSIPDVLTNPDCIFKTEYTVPGTDEKHLTLQFLGKAMINGVSKPITLSLRPTYGKTRTSYEVVAINTPDILDKKQRILGNAFEGSHLIYSKKRNPEVVLNGEVVNLPIDENDPVQYRLDILSKASHQHQTKRRGPKAI